MDNERLAEELSKAKAELFLHGLLAVDVRITRRLGEPGLLESLGRGVALHADDVGDRDKGLLLDRGGPRGRSALRGGLVAPGEGRGQGEDQGDEAAAGGQRPAARAQQGGPRRRPKKSY